MIREQTIRNLKFPPASWVDRPGCRKRWAVRKRLLQGGQGRDWRCHFLWVGCLVPILASPQGWDQTEVRHLLRAQSSGPPKPRQVVMTTGSVTVPPPPHQNAMECSEESGILSLLSFKFLMFCVLCIFVVKFDLSEILHQNSLSLDD